MAEEYYLSIITGLEGYDTTYSPSEFTDHLMADFSSEEYKYGRVFWRRESYHDCNSASYERDINESIKSVLGAIAYYPGWWRHYLIQFWAPKVDGRHHYLTTSDQPFSVGFLYKGLCWYRKQSMDHYCVVEEGAREEQLGAVGRVYRNKHPESTPDLRLYSPHEFPLRDHATRCSFRSYLALPVFDNLLRRQCYGVLEVLSFDTANMEHKFLSLDRGLQMAELRSTHFDFFPINHQTASMPPKYEQQSNSEISKMLEVAIKAVPQLQMAQVWVPCKQCANTSNNLTCMERVTFINVEDGIVNSCTDIDSDMFDYLQACEFHNLQIEKGIARALMSSNSKSCFCQHLCDLSISENPLAHYAQKARLSICFALCVESVHNRNDIYVIEFFLQCNCEEDACGGSFLHLLLRIIEMELKSFELALGRQLGEELVVELCQHNAIEYDSIKYVQEKKHQHSKELNMLMLMEEYRERNSQSNFMKYLQTTNLCSLRPSEKRWQGWVFFSSDNDVNSNSSLMSNPIEEKIKLLMNDIASKLFWDSYSLVQFWAPKMEEDRCYLSTSDQPFALGCLGKGLALFREQCTKHLYFVDEKAKEEELGPPGRVFRNGHPEITPDLCLYSTRDFSLRNYAAHCCLRKYFALPVFDFYQHQCVGVLEFVEVSDSTIEVIGKALEVAEHRKLALAEIMDALLLVSKIPQLYMAEVWVPHSECPSIDNNISCMELALSTKSRREFRLPMCRIHHVQTKKGIAGMALASENKSCLCRNSCDFGIAEQPLAHYAHRARLVVEVIEFSEANKPTFFGSDQRDTFPLKFKTIQYGKKEHQYSRGQQVQYVSDGMDSVRTIAQGMRCSDAAANSKKEDVARKTNRGMRKIGLHLKLEDLKPHLGKRLKDVTEQLGVGRSTIKRTCRYYGIHRWPCNGKYIKNPSLFETQISQLKMRPSSTNNLVPSGMALHQNMPNSKTKSTQHSSVPTDNETVIIKANYKDDFIKFQLCLSSGMDTIVEEVATRLNLKLGSFKLKYLDEDNDEILLACDVDLQLCLKSLTAAGKTCLLLFVQLICK